MSDAIEGLAIFSTIPVFKDRLSKDTQILKKLVSFHSQFRSKASLVEFDIPGTVPYGPVFHCRQLMRMSTET